MPEHLHITIQCTLFTLKSLCSEVLQFSSNAHSIVTLCKVALGRLAAVQRLGAALAQTQSVSFFFSLFSARHGSAAFQMTPSVKEEERSDECIQKGNHDKVAPVQHSLPLLF